MLNHLLISIVLFFYGSISLNGQLNDLEIQSSSSVLGNISIASNESNAMYLNETKLRMDRLYFNREFKFKNLEFAFCIKNDEPFDFRAVVAKFSTYVNRTLESFQIEIRASKIYLINTLDETVELELGKLEDDWNDFKFYFRNNDFFLILNCGKPRLYRYPILRHFSRLSIKMGNTLNNAIYGLSSLLITKSKLRHTNEDIDLRKATSTCKAFSICSTNYKLEVLRSLKGSKGRRGRRGKTGIQGIKGDKGSKGYIGWKGMLGKRGKKGEQGVKGEKGIEGIKGHKGELGSLGPQGKRGLPGRRNRRGKKGLRGLHGETGDRGKQGRTGSRGKVGARGIVGKIGPRGQKGPPGQKGIRGIKGDVGIEGSKGKDGRHGRHGWKGRQGLRGKQGIKGEKGISGDAGVAGEPGIDGMKGLKGPGTRGLPGPPGIKGLPNFVKGKNGENGFDGDKGQSGPPGKKGFPGIAGIKGIRGNRGFPGLTGEKGRKGNPGFRGNHGPPGKEGVKGDKGKFTEGLRGKIGKKGNKGVPGKRGDPGKRGEKGYKEKAGTGGIGKKGFRGKKGFKGRVGSKGVSGRTPKSVKGAPGRRGSKGKKGETGKNGLPGPKGTLGRKGEKGIDGISGKIGKIGINGFKGLKGERGFQRNGFSGIKGIVGNRGKKGLKGLKGIRGEKGSAGDKGKNGDIILINKNHTFVDMMTKKLKRIYDGKSGQLSLLSIKNDLYRLVDELTSKIERIRNPSGLTKLNAAQSCKDIYTRHQELQSKSNSKNKIFNGEFWIDPNHGSKFDAFQVKCIFPNKNEKFPIVKTCLRSNWKVTIFTYVRPFIEDKNWQSKLSVKSKRIVRPPNLEDFYPNRDQMLFLAAGHTRASQGVLINCDQVAVFNSIRPRATRRSLNDKMLYDRPVSFMTFDRKIINGSLGDRLAKGDEYEEKRLYKFDKNIENLRISGADRQLFSQFNLTVINDDCQFANGKQTSNFLFETNNPSMLPIIDLSISRFNSKNEATIGIELEDVCFS